ncbi:MAG: hypothetical protein PWP23_2457 [Candidatus Sumerlaeota bacterium]|nr:hypothetical protein [Candidatus Sumerlaeota bacterium]
MSAHPYEGPKDKTNPWMYLVVALVAVVVVVGVFASGLMRGLYVGMITPPPPPRETKKETVNVQALAEPTKELIAQGRQIYGLNCASCHGPEGLGDGEKGVALNPKPRNFHEATGWKNGPQLSSMWTTLEKGVAGSSMTSYAMMPPQERMAVIHFIRTNWVPEPPEISPDDIAALPGAGASAGGGTIAPPPESGPRIPVQLAMSRLEQPEVRPAAHVEVRPEIRQLRGADLFASHCAQCHGDAGQGVAANKVITSYPYVHVASAPLLGADAPWVADREAFTEILVTPSSGERLHGFATLTTTQVADLHEYVAALAREGATH